jgi:hypothetical protein
MTTAPPPAHPIQSEAPNTAEGFQVILLLILGLALIGAATVALGFAGRSPGGVAIGAGLVLAAGAISVFSAIVRSRVQFETASTPAVNLRAARYAAPAHDTEAMETSRPNGSSPARPSEDTLRQRYQEKYIGLVQPRDAGERFSTFDLKHFPETLD